MKKLYRDKRDGMIAGICAGLADSYHWDPTIVRLVAVFATILTGIWPGVVTYGIGWLLIPEKQEL